MNQAELAARVVVEVEEEAFRHLKTSVEFQKLVDEERIKQLDLFRVISEPAE